MAISTQRILILYIILGLLTQTAIHIHEEATFQTSDYNYFIAQTNEDNQVYEESDTYKSNPRLDVQTDQSNWLIDLFKAGGSAIKFFVKALNPINMVPTDGNNNIEQIAISSILILRALMISILGLEIISYWVNKKQP